MTDAIRYQRCEDCLHAFYFPRAFCPACGRSRVPSVASEGHGTVAAVTLVERAPTAAWREHLPYLLCLVDMDEGFRVMAHGEGPLKIGDRASARCVTIDGNALPCFVAD